MQQRSNHVAIGLAFVGICILIAVVAFLATRLSGPLTRSDAAIAVAAEADNVANQMEAGTYPESPAEIANPEQAETASLPLGLVAGSDYKNVRRQLAAQGFKPIEQARQNCSPYGTTPGEDCADRPEIVACSGTGMGYCKGYWIRGAQGLSVTTQEGPNGSLAGAQLVGRAEIEADLAAATTDEDDEPVDTVPEIQFPTNDAAQ